MFLSCLLTSPLCLSFYYDNDHDNSVSYNIMAQSEEERDRIVSSFYKDISCKSCSDTFTANLRVNMRHNNVTTVLPEDIDADSSEPPHFQGSDEADVKDDNVESLVDDTLMYVLIGVGGLIVIFVLSAVVVIRRRLSSDDDKKTEKVELVSTSRKASFSHLLERVNSHQLKGKSDTSVQKAAIAPPDLTYTNPAIDPSRLEGGTTALAVGTITSQKHLE